jgi:hypothetical protein
MKFSEHISRAVHKDRDTKWLIIGICGLSGLGWLINTQDPSYLIPLSVFFLILFITAYSFSYFVTNIVRRSLLLGGGVFVYFLLRFLGLREIWYVILLLICLISLELSLQKR